MIFWFVFCHSQWLCLRLFAEWVHFVHSLQLLYDILNPAHYVIMSYQYLNKKVCYQYVLITKTWDINIFQCFFQWISCLPRCQCMFWNHIFCPPFVEDYTKQRTMLLALEIGLWMKIKIHNELIELINQIKIMSIMGLSFHYSWFLPVPPLEAVIGCRK